MYEIAKQARFEAAHQIRGHKDPETGGPGKCSHLHGHSYHIAVVVRCPNLLPIGFVVDYYFIGKRLKAIADRWDHKFLNELEEFTDFNTTAENMAYKIFEEVNEVVNSYKKKDLVPEEAYVYYAECSETENTFARYYNPEKVN